MLAGKRVLLIIGGGVGAFKSLTLIRILRERGASVVPVITRAGQEFVTPLSASALAAGKVYTDLFSLTDEAEMGHIELSRDADLVVVAPATADLLGKMANGLADDLASTLLLATDKRVLVAPAMNVRMWDHPATQRNLATLRGDGIHVVGPNDGDMACGEFGPGRMSEPLEIVAAVEAQSEHPIAEAIVRAARAEGAARHDVARFASITGYGVQAKIAGHDVLVGADRLMTREGIDIGAMADAERRLAEQGRTALFAAVDGKVAAVIGVADPVKPASAAAIRALHDLGLKVAMITGDKRETAEAIARETGIDHVIAGVLPDGKVAALDELRAGGEQIAFVGDGINDAPALAQADVGIAIGTGTDIAMEAGDVVLMSGDLRGIVNATALSRRTLKTIRLNFFWAYAYNVALVPIAAGVLYPWMGVLLSPMLAAAAMSFSSIFVVTNSLRLRGFRPQLADT